MDKDVKSLLTIKVLRLIKPSMIGPLALTCDNHDLPGDLWDRELKTDVTAVPGVELLSIGQFLRLPQGFGNMYLGETFACYVVIQNESPVGVTNVSVKVDLQTTSQKFTLADNRTMSLMKTSDTIDIIMHHEIKEMGKHMLICTLTYTVPSSAQSTEPIVLERFFKFQVKKPLDVKTKLYNAEGDEVFLEAQVQNITAAPICLEKVDLEPSAAFNCISMNHLDEKTMLIRTRFSMISPNAIPDPKWPNLLLDVDASQQFLYRLIPKQDNARVATNIGKLDIVWRTTMGDRGRLQTSQLQRQVAVLNDLKLIVQRIPDLSTVDKPFDACCKLINTTSDREMDLRLELDPQTEGYCWLGVTKTKLGFLSASQHFQLNLSLFPIRTGLINVTGIKIVDLKRGEKFCFNDIVQVFILGS